MLPYKGFDVFVEALRRLALAGSPVPAVIGGEGVTESVAPGGVPGLVVKAGELSDEVFRDTIDRCAAVVLPYRKATQSGVLSTAFAAGRPVIATDVGSFPDYVDASNGALLKPGDPQELADTIAALRNDQERSERLARGARRTWEERLNPDAAAREILDALGR
jgi:glycosyltransferase involved in cell wall biosynthesis